MKRLLLAVLLVPLTFSGCKKCVQCEVRLKESQNIIGRVDEFCGTTKQVEEEESRLKDEYICISCTVNSSFGDLSSGVQCGGKAFIDSIQASWVEGAQGLGTTADCIYYRDTANVTCVLRP